MNNGSERTSDDFKEALAEHQSEKPKKKKKKPVKENVLAEAMKVKNIGDGIQHAASAIAKSYKK
jgi:hypothetical protein